MKKYVLKSMIVFTMILILGLILIPMIPAEKEVIITDGYELLVDNEALIFDEEEVYYFIEFDTKDYQIIFINVEILGNSLTVFILQDKYTHIIDLLGFSVYAYYDNSSIIFYSDYIGDFTISIRGVLT